MALASDRVSQFNRMMDQLNQYLMERGLMKERNKGYMDLEETSHGNMMTRAREAFKHQLSLQPPIQQLLSRISADSMAGKNTAGLQTQLKDQIKNFGRASLAAVKGEPPDEATMGYIGTLGDTMAGELVQNMGSGTRQKEMISKKYEPEMAIDIGKATMQNATDRANTELRKKEIAVNLMGQKTREGELAVKQREVKTKAQEESWKTYDRWIDMIKDVTSQLSGQGIVPESDYAKSMQDMKEMSLSSKVLDPLPSQLLGSAYTKLNQLRVKMLDRQPLADAEKIFLTRVSNSFQIKKEQALPSTETGQFPSEETESAIRQIEDRIRSKTKISDPAEIRRLAEEYYRISKGRNFVFE